MDSNQSKQEEEEQQKEQQGQAAPPPYSPPPGGEWEEWQEWVAPPPGAQPAGQLPFYDPPPAYTSPPPFSPLGLGRGQGQRTPQLTPQLTPQRVPREGRRGRGRGRRLFQQTSPDITEGMTTPPSTPRLPGMAVPSAALSRAPGTPYSPLGQRQRRERTPPPAPQRVSLFAQGGQRERGRRLFGDTSPDIAEGMAGLAISPSTPRTPGMATRVESMGSPVPSAALSRTPGTPHSPLGQRQRRERRTPPPAPQRASLFAQEGRRGGQRERGRRLFGGTSPDIAEGMAGLAISPSTPRTPGMATRVESMGSPVPSAALSRTPGTPHSPLGQRQRRERRTPPMAPQRVSLFAQEGRGLRGRRLFQDTSPEDTSEGREDTSEGREISPTPSTSYVRAPPQYTMPSLSLPEERQEYASETSFRPLHNWPLVLQDSNDMWKSGRVNWPGRLPLPSVHLSPPPPYSSPRQIQPRGHMTPQQQGQRSRLFQDTSPAAGIQTSPSWESSRTPGRVQRWRPPPSYDPSGSGPSGSGPSGSGTPGSGPRGFERGRDTGSGSGPPGNNRGRDSDSDSE